MGRLGLGILLRVSQIQITAAHGPGSTNKSFKIAYLNLGPLINELFQYKLSIYV